MPSLPDDWRQLPPAEQHRRLREQALALPVVAPPLPWIQTCSISAGGVTSAGWTADELVLLVLHEGYSLTHPDTGERVERNRDARATYAALSTTRLTFTVPSTREVVPIFGLFGGGGILGTADHLWLEIIAPAWPDEMVLLYYLSPAEPGANRFDGAHRLYLPGLGDDLRGCGFAPSGQRFMVVASDGALVYHRQ